MILGATASVAYDAFEDLDYFDGFDDQSGFFKNFTADRGIEEFARFDDSARKRPESLQRRVSSLDQEDALAIDDESAHARNGEFGIAAANTAPSL
ncbi:MAG: hypothetical protein JWO80_6094 [Bryobacterales bacterium]|nr:hypothetical protein [Bryobacterales bacterium]